MARLPNFLVIIRSEKLSGKGQGRGAKKRTFRFGKKNVSFPKVETFRFADYTPRGKVIDYRVPIEIEGVLVNDGDMLVGDIDGVCVVPRQIEEEVFTRALEKARGERIVLKKIQEGMKARDAFDKFGIM